MSDSLPPPLYSKKDPDNTPMNNQEVEGTQTADPQILIIPTTNTLNFQKGFLGAEDEQATIEGELQIKGINPSDWEKLTMSLRTVEAAFEVEIELGSFEIVLFSRSSDSPSTFPSSFPFTIPLAMDTPQSTRTPHSSLAHILTASLFPTDPLQTPIIKTLIVHTRRFSSHLHTLPVSPEVHILDDPTRVEVEVPRTTFKTEELIPVYVTVPPPTRELVVDRGLRLRNVRTELVRMVGVKQKVGGNDITKLEVDNEGQKAPIFDNVTGTVRPTPVISSSSKLPTVPPAQGPTFKTVIARSGASCRFHSFRPVRLRFILRQFPLPGSPSNLMANHSSRDYGQFDSDEDCASITQSTILHSITFQLNVYISFVDIPTRRERISIVTIPLVIIPSSTPLSEISQTLDAAYRKKHDQPPSRTVRQDDVEHMTFRSGEAGPSMPTTIAPPPFEERDAPPPFFSPEAESSTSTRLPTFSESESQIIVLDEATHPLLHPLSSPLIVGEGLEFGFSSSQQFDGHSDDIQRSPTPLHTLEMATQDGDPTALSELHEPERMIEGVNLALVEDHENVSDERPPPPPAMDDPSDPPPSIDSDFRSPENSAPGPNPPPPSHPSYTIHDSPPTTISASINTQLIHAGHAPPPYPNPENSNDQERVTRPPPYMD